MRVPWDISFAGGPRVAFVQGTAVGRPASGWPARPGGRFAGDGALDMDEF
jgi:hypothetical protein